MICIDKVLSEKEIDNLVKEIMSIPVENNNNNNNNNNCLSSYGSINVDDLIETVKELKKVPTYNELLKENQQLKEELNKYTDPKDLTLMFMYCDEKAKDKIKCLEQENQQLKEQLEQKEDIINKAREKIRLLGKFDGNTCTRGLKMWSADFNKLLEILDIDKGE